MLVKILLTFKSSKWICRPLIWRGSEMMAISAQKNKIHVAIATWEWGHILIQNLN